MKKLLTLTFVLLSNTLFSANPDSTLTCDDVFKISPHEQCFVFSSMDWYNTIEIYDIENNKVGKINVKRMGKKQIFQLVYVPYSDWGVGEYVIVAKYKKYKKVCRFIIKDTHTILIYDNDN